ncbi:MAG: hypothetical protein RLZZ519_1468, partial [Bacteroidota bacterium]
MAAKNSRRFNKIFTLSEALGGAEDLQTVTVDKKVLLPLHLDLNKAYRTSPILDAQLSFFYSIPESKNAEVKPFSV